MHAPVYTSLSLSLNRLSLEQRRCRRAFWRQMPSWCEKMHSKTDFLQQRKNWAEEARAHTHTHTDTQTHTHTHVRILLDGGAQTTHQIDSSILMKQLHQHHSHTQAAATGKQGTLRSSCTSPARGNLVVYCIPDRIVRLSPWTLPDKS